MQRTPEEDILRREKYALNSKAMQENEDLRLGLPTDPQFQEARTKRIANYERELAEVKRFTNKAQERIPFPPAENPSVPAPLTENPIAQRVLTEAFCVNRLKEICQLAGDSKLRISLRATNGKFAKRRSLAFLRDFDAKTSMAIPPTSACLQP